MPSPFDPALHHRRSIRLRGYDYSQGGAYFVTIVAQGRTAHFGDVVSGEMRCTPAGQMVAGVWNALPARARFAPIELDHFIVMPNHFHGIIVLGREEPPTDNTPRLGDVVGGFKSLTTVEYIRGVKAHGWPPFTGRLWQRNFYEHIIRNESSLNQIRQYIIDNPINWTNDTYW